jgi:endonuclease-3 related protein
MPTWDGSLAAIVAALAEHYGLPAEAGAGFERAPFPALVTVLLARATHPDKAVRGRLALADAGLLDPQALAEADPAEVSEALKTSGITVSPRVLAPIQRLARWIVERGLSRRGRDLVESLSELDTESLRTELAGLRGIGPGTADALLLFGLSRPVYPVDQATYRILVRHGWLDLSATYDEARAVVEGACHDDPVTLARLSAWLAQVGSEFCRVRRAHCDGCPLRGFLPEGGPIEPELTSA